MSSLATLTATALVVAGQSAANAVRQILWTVEQCAIFAWFELTNVDHDLVVRARAGTGKTTTIVEGVKRYVAACQKAGIRTKALLAAFNKEIATELDLRVKDLGGLVEAKTLHALGFMFVREAWKNVKVDFGNGRAKWLASSVCRGASDSVIDLVAELNKKAREILPLCEDWTEIQTMALQFDLVPDDSDERSGWTMERVCKATLACMDLAMERTQTIDGADMIFLPLAHNWTRGIYDRVVVDEAQDMTGAQLMLAQKACKATGKICIVGDDRQAIYGFRGADSGSLDRLKSELGATELGLTMTYRCGRKIVQAAAKIVPDYRCPDNAHEGTITEIGSDKLMTLATPGDFILSRKNAPLAALCLAFLKDGIRAYIRGKDIGKGLQAVIRKLRVKDIEDLRPALTAWFDKQSAIATRTLDEDKATTRISFLADQRDVILAMSEGCTSVPEVSARIESLFTDDKSADRIMLSTVHKAKGLEANNVFILNETFQIAGPEESNIWYVAITRAKHNLYHVTGSTAN